MSGPMANLSLHYYCEWNVHASTAVLFLWGIFPVPIFIVIMINELENT